MRKFRGWDDYNKCWIYFCLEPGMFWPHNSFGEGVKEWLQYTGIKDKNGKEIFEGDILEWYLGEKDLRNRACVVYENYDTAFSAQVFEPKSVAGTWIKLNAFNYEIIGNIYENKHLLNYGKDK